MATHPETSIDRSQIVASSPGIMVVVHHPHEWPSGSIFIGAGSMTAIALQPTAFSTSEEVRGLSPQERQCYYAVSHKMNQRIIAYIIVFTVRRR